MSGLGGIDSIDIVSNEILVSTQGPWLRHGSESLIPKRLTSSMPMHPLPVLLNQGIPVVLSSDDPAVFGNMGLTFDFFQVRFFI